MMQQVGNHEKTNVDSQVLRYQISSQQVLLVKSSIALEDQLLKDDLLDSKYN
jgi:hypothetical protein